MTYFYIKLDKVSNIIYGYGSRDSTNDIDDKLKQANNETAVNKSIIDSLEKDRYYKYKYLDNKLINTGQSIFPPNEYSVWDTSTDSWKDPRPQTEIIEEKWTEVKNKRNDLLIQSDWTDTLSAKARLGDTKYNIWQEYRQALRDITNQNDPFKIVWPTIPE